MSQVGLLLIVIVEVLGLILALVLMGGRSLPDLSRY
jgi:hypothetical protein